MPSRRQAVSFRFSDETREALSRQALRYGVSQVAVLELLVRILDQGHLTIAAGQTARAGRVPSPPPGATQTAP